MTDARAAAEKAARELLLALGDLPTPPALRVAEVEGNLACLILVWDAARAMPTVGAERRRRTTRRAGCRDDIVDVLAAAGRALTRKQIVKALREAKKGHGPGTVAKALAELTGDGVLVNPQDKRGYRLPGWLKGKSTPSMF